MLINETEQNNQYKNTNYKLFQQYSHARNVKIQHPAQQCFLLCIPLFLAFCLWVIGVMHSINKRIIGARVKLHLIQRELEPAVYLRRRRRRMRRSTSILQVWAGGYIGFKCQKTLRWQALWDVIKRKYDWGAVEQWWRCLWDGLWLCQELAAKSIDPDAIAVCTTNTRAFMYLSCLKAAENLSKPTRGFSRMKCLFICTSLHPLIFQSLDSVRTLWPKQLVTRSFSS